MFARGGIRSGVKVLAWSLAFRGFVVVAVFGPGCVDGSAVLVFAQDLLVPVT